MPPTLAGLRRAAARLLGRGKRRSQRPQDWAVVPVTVRARTADGADMRLLLDVRVEGGTLSFGDLDRFVHEWTVPAAREWVAGHDLAGLQADLAPQLDDVAAVVGERLAGMGEKLHEIELVAAEHLLSSPSADPADGPE